MGGRGLKAQAEFCLRERALIWKSADMFIGFGISNSVIFINFGLYA